MGDVQRDGFGSTFETFPCPLSSFRPPLRSDSGSPTRERRPLHLQPTRQSRPLWCPCPLEERRHAPASWELCDFGPEGQRSQSRRAERVETTSWKGPVGVGASEGLRRRTLGGGSRRARRQMCGTTSSRRERVARLRPTRTMRVRARTARRTCCREKV